MPQLRNKIRGKIGVGGQRGCWELGGGKWSFKDCLGKSDKIDGNWVEAS